MLVFRNVEGSLKLAYYLTHIIGEKLRTMEIPQRVSYDNKKPAILQVRVKAKEKHRRATKDEEKEKERCRKVTKEAKEKIAAAAPVT